MFGNFSITPTLLGVRITESAAATQMPEGKPITEDMRMMVEDLIARGEYRRKPTMYKLPDDSLVVHPAIMQSLRSHIKQATEDEFRKVFYG